MTARERRTRTSTVWIGPPRSAAATALVVLGGTLGFGPCTTKTETVGAAPPVDAPRPSPTPTESPGNSAGGLLAPVIVTSEQPTSSATAPTQSAPTELEPTCADLHMKLGRYPGLLPEGVPAAVAEHLVYPRGRGAVAPPIPIRIGSDVYFVHEGIDHDQLRVFSFSGDRFDLVHTVPVPSAPSHDRLSSYQLDVAAGPSSLGLAVVSGRQMFFVLVDTRKWVVKKIVPLPIEEETPFTDFHHPHIAWGGGNYGIAVRTDHRLVWQAVTENGKPIGPPSYFKSSSYIEPRVAYNGSKFGILAGRSGDSNSYSIGLWEMSPDGKGAQYLPIVDSPEPEIKDFFDRRYFYIGGALVWKAGAYTLGAMSQTNSARKPDHTAQLIHFRGGSGTRIEDCGKTSF